MLVKSRRVLDRPYSKFQAIMTKGMSFYITIDGHLFEIPFQFWWQVRKSRCKPRVNRV
jgi:hypothetical protein